MSPEPTTTAAELRAFEVATADLVGLALRSTDGLEVSLPQFRLLRVLHELGRTKSTWCAQALGVAASSVTRLADRLDASGHLVRGTDPDNRSIVTLELTPAGHAAVEQAIAVRRRALGLALDRLAPGDRAAGAAALRRLHAILAEEDDGDRPLLF